MAYEMLTGAHPFGRHVTPQQLVTAHLTETPAPLVGKHGTVPPALAALVLQSLEKDPARRPASASAVLATLDTAATPVPASETLPTRPSRRWKIELVLVAVVMAGAVVWALARFGRTGAPASAMEQSLAVLPLANLSGDKADDYFGIGLAEEITRAVAKNGVRVIGRVSAGALQAKGLDDRAIAKELGVTSLLTGTVQRAGDQIRINVTLSARDGAVRWTEKYDRPLANVFAVQDEIARTVATTLLGTMGRSAAPARSAETSDPEAHALFLQGQVLFNRRGAGNLHQAIALFQQATARDPQYARAQASLAMSLAVLPAYVLDSTPEILSSAVSAAERAIAMDSTIPESFAALGYGYSLLGQLRRADDSFRRAIARDSTMATTWGWYGLLAGRLREYQVAHDRIATARALEPASMIARIWDTQILGQERRFAEAEALASSTIAMDSTFMLAWSWRANALLGMGQSAQAVTLLERYASMVPSDRPEEAHCLLAYAYAKAGRVGDARAKLDWIRARSGGRLPAVGAIAAALEELGDHEAAVALLGKAIERSDTWTVQFPQLSRYDRLRRDPRAAAMLNKLGTMP